MMQEMLVAVLYWNQNSNICNAVYDVSSQQ